MSDDIVIKIENLSKLYRIGQIQAGRKTFREAMSDMVATPFRRLKSFGQSSHREEDSIWALKDVSFEVKQGGVLGIIGPNGAGKSTLLKILSEITSPTEGRVEIRGRVASLLEVGTGFHQELTGRENVFLNGAILGMTREEIKRKFDEIVAFAETDKFIDTPVKRYSSGMKVRLAFAVAAHLEPEILLVDEVLAVGDAEFQKKCLGKMENVAKEGRTVLFVSHNMVAIQSLCDKAILLSHGRISQFGSAVDVVADYLLSKRNYGITHNWEFHPGRVAGSEPIITYAEILDDTEQGTDKVLLGSLITIRIYLKPRGRIRAPVVGIGIENYLGLRIVSFNSAMNGMIINEKKGPFFVDCKPNGLLLSPGRYRIKLVFANSTQDLDVIENAIEFTVQGIDYFETGLLPSAQQGVIVCDAAWSLCNL